jgi:hypothetical protein
MRKIRRLTAVATAIAVVAIAGPATAASATPSGSPASPPGPESTVQARVDAALRANPGSHRVGDNAVEISKGVLIVAAPQRTVGSVSPQAPGDLGGCSLYNLCLYEDAGFGSPHGYYLAFYNCGFVDIGKLKFPEGGPAEPGQPRWNDRVSSIINHQTHGVRSLFYNFGYSPVTGQEQFLYLDSLYAYGYWRDLSSNHSWDGKPMNDVIDGTVVC